MNTLKTSVLLLGILSLCISCKDTPKTATTEPDTRTTVEMVTNYGTIQLELYNETPRHRDNFIKLVNDKVYDSLLFHRVIKTFMIQGGDPDSRHALTDAPLGEGDLGYTVPAEFVPTLFHKKGVLAAAREDSQDRASSAVQFYIVQGKTYTDSLLKSAEATINKRLARNDVINDPAHKHLWDSLQMATKDATQERYQRLSDRIDTLAKYNTGIKAYRIPDAQRSVYKSLGGTPTLDQNYTVFGEVTKGIDVVDAIADAHTNAADRPVKDVRILSVRILP